LKEINSSEYCNVGEIIDIPKSNTNLSRYNITLIDGYDVDLKINSVKYGNDKYNIDITNEITKSYCSNNGRRFSIPANTNVNTYKGDPWEHFKRQFFIEIRGVRSLFVSYSVNNHEFQQEYAVTANGSLVDGVDIDFANLNFIETKLFCNDGSDIFREFVKTIVFNENVIGKSNEFIRANIDANQNINAVHLRIEEDAIQHWGAESKFADLVLYKKLVELRYIDIIKRLLSKEDLTIFLASDYDNGVIDYMRENNYRYIITPKFSAYRDVNAITDMHIGQHCNNVCVGVWESSYSYALFFRIYRKIHLKTAVLYLTNIKNTGSFLDNK